MYALFWYVSYMPILKSFFLKGQKLQFFSNGQICWSAIIGIFKFVFSKVWLCHINTSFTSS